MVSREKRETLMWLKGKTVKGGGGAEHERERERKKKVAI